MNIPRLLIVDLLRFLSFIAIGIHHFAWIFWYTRDVPLFIASQSYTGFMQLVTETYARSLSFSGFTIVGLASFLQAFTRQSVAKRIALFTLLLAGWAVFCALITQETGFYLGWDVYPLLFTGLLTCVLAEKLPAVALKCMGITGYIMLLLPFWNFAVFGDLPFFLRHIIVGVCENDLADWPVLPWIGLVWLCYWAGWEVKKYFAKGSATGALIQKKEAIFWAVLLMASLPQLGSYFHVPLGPEFPCFVYRQPPYIFWSHFIWVIFIVRLAFDPRIAEVSKKSKPLLWVSNLAMTRHFWLAYLIHYCLAYLFNGILDAMGGEKNSWYVHAIGIIYAMYFFIVEFLTRGIYRAASSKILRRWPSIFRKS